MGKMEVTSTKWVMYAHKATFRSEATDDTNIGIHFICTEQGEFLVLLEGQLQAMKWAFCIQLCCIREADELGYLFQDRNTLSFSTQVRVQHFRKLWLLVCSVCVCVSVC